MNTGRIDKPCEFNISPFGEDLGSNPSGASNLMTKRILIKTTAILLLIATFPITLLGAIWAITHTFFSLGYTETIDGLSALASRINKK